MFLVDVNTCENVRTFEHIFKHVCTVVHPCQQGTKSGYNVEIAELFSIRLDVIQKWMETQLLEPIIHMPYSYLSKFPLDRITEKYCDFSF